MIPRAGTQARTRAACMRPPQPETRRIQMNEHARFSATRLRSLPFPPSFHVSGNRENVARRNVRESNPEG